LQFGLLLFLLARVDAGCSAFMDLVNLAHGSLYMMGAYFAADLCGVDGNFVIGVLLALGARCRSASPWNSSPLRHLYGRDHLDQVLATFG